MVKEIQVTTTVMETLLRHMDCPAFPNTTIPNFLDRHDAICESLRQLDMSEIESATRDLIEYIDRVTQTGKRKRPSKIPRSQRGATVLGRVVEEIRSYQEQTNEDYYKKLKEEIEVVVKVVTALQQYLDALALPLSEDSEYVEKVKVVGESLQRLDVTGLEKAMQDLYECFRLGTAFLCDSSPGGDSL